MINSCGELHIALVVPNMAFGGGVTTVGRFIRSALSDSGQFSVDLISLATSASDLDSVSILRPRSWRKGIQVSEVNWDGFTCRHVGSQWAEVEACRYQPRGALTEMLNSYDLVQIVAGSPAWGKVARDVLPPVALQVATLAAVERVRRQSIERSPVGAWRRLMTRLTSRIELEALDCADVVFVENDWMQEFVTQRLGEERVVFAPPGIDTSIFCPKPVGDSVTEPYIFSVGRFADLRKNVPLLFRSYAAFSQSMDHAPNLVLAGKNGPSVSDWAIADSLGVRDKIRFLREVPFDQLAELYQNAMMFVSSSDEEGFGMVIVEAMASGVPVISTRSGGPQTILTNGVNGLLVDVGDVDGLARAMTQLHTDPSLARKMGDAARRTAEEKYSLEATGKKFIDKYIELLGGDRQP